MGVESFIERLKSRGRDVRALGHASIAAIGPATAARLANYALRLRRFPTNIAREEIVSAIGIKQIRGKRFLIPRAEVAREELPKILRDSGAREVVVAPAYRTVKPKGAHVARMRELIASGAIDLVTFTSSSTVTNFCELLGLSRKGIRAAAIGPITAATAGRAWIRSGCQPRPVHDRGARRGDSRSLHGEAQNLISAARWSRRTLTYRPRCVRPPLP